MPSAFAILTTLWLLIPCISAHALEPKTALDDARQLQLDYKSDANRLTFHAVDAQLSEVVAAFRAKAPVTIDVTDEHLFIGETITAQVLEQPAEAALRKLFDDFNYVLIVADEAEPVSATGTRPLLKLILLSRKDTDSYGSNDLELREPRPEAVPTSVDSDEAERLDAFTTNQHLAPDIPDFSSAELALLRDLLRLDSDADILKTLHAKENATDWLMQAIADELRAQPDSPSTYAGIDLMKSIDPDGTLHMLDNWLQTGDQLTSMTAAVALGRTGWRQSDVSQAIALLEPVMSPSNARSVDGITRQMAAYSLAEIGGQGVTVLIDVYREGVPETSKAAAMAVALKGDSESQTLLAQEMSGVPLSTDVKPRDVILRHLPKVPIDPQVGVTQEVPK